MTISRQWTILLRRWLLSASVAFVLIGRGSLRMPRALEPPAETEMMPRLLGWAKPIGLSLAALCWLYLLLSILSYSTTDPYETDVFVVQDSSLSPSTTREFVTNWGGPFGARIIHQLRHLIGPWSLFLAMVLYLLGLVGMIRLGRMSRPCSTIAGVALVLIAAVGLTHRYIPAYGSLPAVGPGGYLGAIAVATLETQIGQGGYVLILGSALAGGLWLSRAILVHEPLAWFRILWGWISFPLRFRQAVQQAGSIDPAQLALTAPARGQVSTKMSALAAPTAGGSSLSKKDSPKAGSVTRVNPAASPRVAIGSDPSDAPALPSPEHAGEELVAAPPQEFVLPELNFLEAGVPNENREHDAKIHERAELLERTLLEYGFQVRVVQIDTGPVITQFEIELEAGLRVSRIISLANDLAIALAVPSVRIVAPIPGKTTVGIEVPNENRSIVRLREIIEEMQEKSAKYQIPLYLGRDVKGNPLAFDLAKMPHLLIAGRTGTGKSVCLNAMILSILMTRTPEEVRLILIDPKMVELSQFKSIPHLMHPVVTDMKKAESLLSWACDHMDERYSFLARANVRNIQSYNKLGAEEIYRRLAPETEEERDTIPTYMANIVIIADEMADLMMTAAKEVESHVVRLAQKARAVGMHLIIATQRPTVDVITGLIKGNLPARIAFQVASRNDSGVVLDEKGAEKLLGNGDMLFLIPNTSLLIRAQGTFVGDEEIAIICEYLSQYPVEFSMELIKLQAGGGLGGAEGKQKLKERDDLYEQAIEVVVREQRGSTSLLQKALGIGYGRASRMIDFMAEDGIVGEYKSGKHREVLYSWEEWEALNGASQELDDEMESPALSA